MARAGIETRRFDATQPAAMHAALDGVDGVVNCIAGDARVIVASARALFDACAQAVSPPRIVHLSTMMVYGTTTGSAVEVAPLKGDWDDYSVAKAEVERLTHHYRAVVVLRPGIVYGPGSPIWTGRIGRWLRQKRLGDLGTAGLGYCNLVHVDDVVEAVQRALRLPGIEGEAFNLSLHSPPTWNEYFRQFAAALGSGYVSISHARLVTELNVIAPPLKILEIIAAKLPGKWQPPEPIRPWFLRLCAQPLQLDVHKAEEVLGMRWTPLEQGLRQSAAWLLAGGNSGAMP